MSQHDYSIANGGGSTVRADINAALAAIVTQNSGSSAPSTTFAYQMWADTTAGLLKIRNAANSAWITIGTLASTNLGLASLSAAQSFTAAQRGTVVALTDASSIATDLSLGNNFSVTLGGSRTLANPTNITAGQSGVIVITQDGTGSRTLAYGSNWKFPAGTAPTLTTTANAVDVLCYYVESASRISARLIGDVK